LTARVEDDEKVIGLELGADDLHIKNLRAKIEPLPRSLRYIETVYGVGYRFARE